MTDKEQLWPGGPVLYQAEHFRLGTDCVLLADFARTTGARRGIDLGCASGAAMLLLLSRTETLRMTGLEIVPEAAELARRNLAENGLETRGEIVTGDIRDHRALFRAGSFDLVIANPPYYPAGSGALPADADRAAARSELKSSLEEICRAAAYLLRTGGRRGKGVLELARDVLGRCGHSLERLADASVEASRKTAWSPSACAWCAGGRRAPPVWCWWRRAGAGSPGSRSNRPCSCRAPTAGRARSCSASIGGEKRINSRKKRKRISSNKQHPARRDRKRLRPHLMWGRSLFYSYQ